MKKISLLITGIIFSLLMTANAVAAQNLTCEQLNNTNWNDSADFQFGGVSLSFNDLETDPFFIAYDISYYGGNFEFGTQTSSCA